MNCFYAIDLRHRDVDKNQIERNIASYKINGRPSPIRSEHAIAQGFQTGNCQSSNIWIVINDQNSCIEFPSLEAAYDDATQAAVDIQTDACCEGERATDDAFRFETRLDEW